MWVGGVTLLDKVFAPKSNVLRKYCAVWLECMSLLKSQLLIGGNFSQQFIGTNYQTDKGIVYRKHVKNQSISIYILYQKKKPPIKPIEFCRTSSGLAYWHCGHGTHARTQTILNANFPIFLVGFLWFIQFWFIHKSIHRYLNIVSHGCGNRTHFCCCCCCCFVLFSVSVGCLFLSYIFWSLIKKHDSN